MLKLAKIFVWLIIILTLGLPFTYILSCSENMGFSVPENIIIAGFILELSILLIFVLSDYIRSVFWLILIFPFTSNEKVKDKKRMKRLKRISNKKYVQIKTKHK